MVDLGQIGSFAGGLVAVATPFAAWFRSALRKRDHKIELLEAALDAKDERIAELKEQQSELRITAEIQKRFLSQLPPPTRRRPGGQSGGQA